MKNIEELLKMMFIDMNNKLSTAELKRRRNSSNKKP